MIRDRSRPRLLAVLLLAYTLALQGLLGALSAGAQAQEARLASQLGVICTIHGIADPALASGDADPTPGKLACVEHCLLAAGLAATMPRPAEGPAQIISWSRFPAPPVAASRRVSSPEAAPPPPRGPPAAVN
jgi:hypothetical protein